jgi:vitamin B12 transporter
MRYFLCMALTAVAVLAAFGDEGDGSESPPIDVGQIDVSAQAYSPVSLAPAGNGSVVTAMDIEKSGASNAADALQLAPGAFISRYGPDASAAMVSLRGSSSGQVLVIVDGVRLNDAKQGAPDLSSIPADQIEKIELLKGGASAVYGADAVGGVVLITTKRPSPGSFALSFENASYPTAGKASSLVDGQSLGVEAGTRIGGTELSFVGTGERASGKYAYGDPRETRENADLAGGSAKLGLRSALADGLLRASVSGSYREAGVPGSLTYVTPSERQRDSAVRGELGWSSDALAGGDLSFDLLTHGSWTKILDEEISTDDRLSGTGLDLRSNYQLAPWISLGFGGSFGYEAADSNTFDALSGGQPTRSSLGLYLEPTIIAGERLKLAPALRYDWSNDYEALLSAMLGLVWKATSAVEARVSAGRSYRAPTFNQLYYPYFSNPDLKCEKSWSGEAGLAYAGSEISVSASGFARLIDDMIKNDESWTPQNIGRVFTPGAELSFSARYGAFSIRSGYEFVYPLDLSAGGGLSDAAVLRDISMHKLNASVDYRADKFEVGLGERFWSDRDAYSLPDVILLDAHLSLGIGAAARLNLSIENLLDKDYEINAGYPMPGMTVKLGTKLTL